MHSGTTRPRSRKLCSPFTSWSKSERSYTLASVIPLLGSLQLPILMRCRSLLLPVSSYANPFAPQRARPDSLRHLSRPMECHDVSVITPFTLCARSRFSALVGTLSEKFCPWPSTLVWPLPRGTSLVVVGCSPRNRCVYPDINELYILKPRA